MMHKPGLVILGVVMYIIGYTQGSIGIGTTSPDNSAILHLESSAKGLLLPRMSTSARLDILSPAEGLLVYDSTEAALFQYKNSAWQEMGSGGSSVWNTFAEGIEYSDGKVAIGSGMLHRIVMNPEAISQGATIELFDADSTRTFLLEGSEALSQGAALEMYNKSGVLTAKLDAEHANGILYGGGSLTLRDDLQDRRVQILASEQNDQALVHMYNTSGQLSVALNSDTDGTAGGGISLNNALGLERIQMFAEYESQRAYMHMLNQADVPTVAFDADYMATGKGRVTTDEIEIRGGADLAEMFNVTGDRGIAPGSVVCVDPENDGALVLSRKAQDRTVVGVISGANGVAPGLLMGHRGTEAFGEFPVAIAGRVYVKANDRGGEIKPGDFLTTSPVRGQAMRVEDFDTSRGAILGKALSSRDPETGFVLILVHLQ